MTNIVTLIEPAKEIAAQTSDTKFWFIFLVLAGVLVWFFKQSREREVTLRAELSAHQATHETQNRVLAELVGQNTEVIRANSACLQRAERVVSDAEKTLIKFL